MSAIYLLIVVFLLCLAFFDLFVGVSNDAVNFLQSAVGARVATFRTILLVASCGVIIGAVMSSGMMDVARHGIMTPSQYAMSEVMVLFLAVMVTDVIVLDVFNSLGMPTSTTVSLVFELLGGAFILAVIKMAGDPTLVFSDLLNTDKALSVIIAIFVSVAIAFVFGTVAQWLARVVFTFHYRRSSPVFIALFGGLAFTILAYFIFIKGVGKSPYIHADARAWIGAHTTLLLVLTMLGSSVLMGVLHTVRINVFKVVVLMGTFALAMAFAGNDLVNFIGVPLAGLDSFQDYLFHGQPAGISPDEFMMTSLMESATTPPAYLMLAGVVMIVAMATSKKARRVIQTSVDLSRQDEGDEMFGSSRAARAIVRTVQNISDNLVSFTQHFAVCRRAGAWIDSRFNTFGIERDDQAAFDVVRAAINLVLASMLITLGTTYKLPLSTTYVTFMVAMGTSLADRAWSRESAVFRITGVLSVIGGWFITAGAAFVACALVCLAMYYGGLVAQLAFICLVVYILFRSGHRAKDKGHDAEGDDMYRLMMRTQDPEIVWDLLKKYVRRSQSEMAEMTLSEYSQLLDGFEDNRTAPLRRVLRRLRSAKERLRKVRRQQLVALHHVPMEVAVERNTWFHVGINATQQYIYCLQRMLEPVKEHVDNNFTPLPQELKEEYRPIKMKIMELMRDTENQISTGRFENYRETLAAADTVKDELSEYRHRQIARLQGITDNSCLQVALLYLNLLQESQQLLSNMRHQLRAAKKFME